MSTFVREGGLRVQILSNDHPPPHVHVRGGGFHAKILIGDENTAPELDELKSGDVRRIKFAMRLVAENQELLLREWKSIHGE